MLGQSCEGEKRLADALEKLTAELRNNRAQLEQDMECLCDAIARVEKQVARIADRANAT